MAAEDADVKPISTIPTANAGQSPGAKIATSSCRAPCVLHGSRVDNVQITEIESKQRVYMAASENCEEVSSLAFLDANAALVCSVKGQLCLVDTRQPPEPQGDLPVSSALAGERWCAAAGTALPGSDARALPIARLSSEGRVVLTDVRNTPKPLKSAMCRASASRSGTEFLCVSWAPRLEGCLAVSGFDGTVHVYDTHSWGTTGEEAAPAFVHRGHLFSEAEDGGGDPPLVTAHAWHPWKHRMLLSAASDGSLHVWDWADSCSSS
uniref:WD repeat-containing protein 73 n=1 Tax=Sphenodon punctatus TaxID=8508 RepID=A0A8D0HIH6_SPHPU